MQVSQYLHENRWRQRPCSLAMNMVLSASGRVPREGSVLLWRTTLLARSSELYLPAHGGRERWMRLMGSQLSCQPGRRIPRAAASGMLRPMKSGGRSDRSQIVPRTVRREVYKAPVPPQRYRSPGFCIRFPALVSKTPLVGGSFPEVDTKTVLAVYHAS
jgi:hypothetical protein